MEAFLRNMKMPTGELVGALGVGGLFFAEGKMAVNTGQAAGVHGRGKSIAGKVALSLPLPPR